MFDKLSKTFSKEEEEKVDLAEQFLSMQHEEGERHLNKAIAKIEKNDPLLRYGVGIYMYRSFMRTLIVLFLILSVLAASIAHIYS